MRKLQGLSRFRPSDWEESFPCVAMVMYNICKSGTFSAQLVKTLFFRFNFPLSSVALGWPLAF